MMSYAEQLHIHVINSIRRCTNEKVKEQRMLKSKWAYGALENDEWSSVLIWFSWAEASSCALGS